MSIAGIPPNNNLNLNMQNVNFNQAKADFKALTTAVNAGDLNTAKTAYAALLADFGVTSTANNPALANTNIQALGNALQANDINAAKNIVTAMQQMQHGHHAHRGGHGGGGRAKSLEAMLFGTTPQPGTEDTTTAATTDTRKNDINFTA